MKLLLMVLFIVTNKVNAISDQAVHSWYWKHFVELQDRVTVQLVFLDRTQFLELLVDP